MKLNKFDEIDSLIHGVEFMVNNNDHKFPEVFYYTDLNEQTGVKQVIRSHLCRSTTISVVELQ